MPGDFAKNFYQPGELIIMPTTVITENTGFVKPSESLRKVAQKTSAKPAKRRYTHAIKFSSLA